jgi:hypothetical protein
VGVVGTSPVQAKSTTAPLSFVLHAAIANTGTISASTNDPNVVNGVEELLAGQSLSFEDFVGTVWVLGSASGQVFHIFGEQYDDTVSSNVTKAP